MLAMFHGDKKRSVMRSSPTRLICVSFALVILTGTLLLMLPISSKDGSFTPLTSALFTATSATCVTGLVLYDTFTKWTVFGQLVILALIQIGGLGLVTFTTFFNLALGRKVGLRGMQLAQESINFSSFTDINKLIKMVVTMSLLIECVGAMLLSITFVPKYGREGAYIAIFLAVSAFCNAGFDILGREGLYSSLVHYNGDLLVMVTISALIILGGLGFVVWYDLLNYRKEKRLMLHTKIVLVVTAGLIVCGMLVFLPLEWGNPKTLGSLPVLERFTAAFFQSVTCRTAGFNSIDIEGMTGASKLVSIILMFIGAAPGSTGGGIKVTTFAVMFMTVVSVIRGNDDTLILSRRVHQKVVYKAFSIALIGILAVAVSSGIIFFTSADAHKVTGLNAVFESVSAFATVGLSSGVSGIANLPSQIVLILSMFIGRVGPVSFAFSIAMLQTYQSKGSVLPEGKIMVG